MLKLVHVAVALALIAVPTVGSAEEPDGGQHHGPGPESIAACKDKSEGDSCEFDAPRGHVVGTCHRARAGELACFHPHPHQP
jgi:hypothetical protein